MLTRTEKRKIRETIIGGGTINKALKQWAAGRGYRLGKDSDGCRWYYLVDVEGAVAEHEKCRKRNKSPNVIYGTEAEYRASLLQGDCELDWCSETESWDSWSAEDLATILWHYLKGKSARQIVKKFGGSTPDVVKTIPRPLLRKEDRGLRYRRWRNQAWDKQGELLVDKVFKSEAASYRHYQTNELDKYTQFAISASVDQTGKHWESVISGCTNPLLAAV